MRTSGLIKRLTSKTCFALAVMLPAIYLLILPSCRHSGATEEGPPKLTTLVVGFENKVDSLPLVLDTLMYENSSGDLYKVTDLQYFVSDITIHRNDGLNYTALNDDGIHYIDARIPGSLSWTINTSVPDGAFDSISFTFGINAVKNYSNRFLNPPERDMSWPDILGGGYHYMKMNMLWKKASMNQTSPFNFHIGIGQIYKGNVINTDSILNYVQNYFYVSLPASAFSIENGQTKYMVITMNVNKWFTGNNEFDFADYMNMMMQDQTALNNACLNGRHAFTVRFSSGK